MDFSRKIGQNCFVPSVSVFQPLNRENTRSTASCVHPKLLLSMFRKNCVHSSCGFLSKTVMCGLCLQLRICILRCVAADWQWSWENTQRYWWGHRTGRRSRRKIFTGFVCHFLVCKFLRLFFFVLLSDFEWVNEWVNKI